MKYKILAKEWRSARHTVGFIAYDCENPVAPGQWNSVVGYVPDELTIALSAPDLEGKDYSVNVLNGGASEDGDAQYIAANGAKIEWNIAKELFPYLDITKHKYYPSAKN